MREARVRWVLCVLAALALRSVAEAQPGGAADNADKVIASLRQVASDLDKAVKVFQRDLDREIALHDSGYRAPGGRRISGADTDFISGPADVVQTTTRKLLAARMISARRPGYAPQPVIDSDRLQALILEARTQINLGSGVMRRLLVVSAKELNPRTYGEQSARLVELRKARDDAMEAAKKALIALPVPLPDADSQEQQRDRAWDLMVARMPVTPSGDRKAIGNTQAGRPVEAAILPIRFEEGKSLTLVNEHFCRVALTDSGMEDRQGRRLFYQEEWVTRPGSLARTTGTGAAGILVLIRRAVAVDTKTGQHTLLRSYPARQFQGDLDNFHEFQESDYIPKPISNVASLETAAPPTTQDLTSALASVERRRQELHAAVLDFKRLLQEALTRNDELLAAQEKAALDDELPTDLREKLFAIRGHLAGATALLNGEDKVRRAVEEASGSVRVLEAMLAWINGNAFESEAPARDSRARMEAQNRADTQIHLMRSLEREALAALPQDLPMPEAQFPALQKDLIVRIRRLGGSAQAGTSQYRHEVWRLEAPAGGERQVKRTIAIVEIDSKSGSQIPTRREVKYYPVDPGEMLEEIYDENAAQ